jgi:hypothetical protein
VNQSGGLESVPSALPLQIAMRLAMQFLIDEFKQTIIRILAPVTAPIA